MGVIAIGPPILLRSPDIGGAGYIAGEAPGLVTVNGAAGMREVECRDRASRVLVEVTRSAPDGTYRFNGISPARQFDVIGRDYSGIYNDAIIGRVRPEPYSVISATGAFLANNATKTLDRAIDIYGGEGHSVAVVSGAAPPGITFSVVTSGPPLFDHVARWLVASGTTSAGVYTWTIRVSAANESRIDIACAATFT